MSMWEMLNHFQWFAVSSVHRLEDDIVVVSITALKEAFGDKYKDMVGKEYTAEAIG